MTIEEKRTILARYCTNTACSNCILRRSDWDCHIGEGSEQCMNIYEASESELDRGLQLIEDSNNEPSDNPIKPDYYNDTKIAPIDVIEDWDLDFCLGSALKYIKRAGKKDNNPSVQDLRKVIWYVERRIKELEDVTE